MSRCTALDFTVGSDVEFFLTHRGHGYVPATAFNTPGSKHEPIPLGRGTFHRDNISVEIQPPPASNPDVWMQNNNDLYVELHQLYTKRNLGLAMMPAIRFKKSIIKGIEEADEIGCDPDKCAYTGTEVEPTDADTMGEVRTASGHIHIGIDGKTEEELRTGVQWLDQLEALPGLRGESSTMRLYGSSSSVRPNRRKYYGQAGRYRLKPYGVEYRTPSVASWYHYCNGGAYGLFASIYMAFSLQNQGLTPAEVLGENLHKRTIETINKGTWTNAASSITLSVQDKLNALAGTTAMLSYTRNKYGDVPNLFRAGR